MLGEENKLRPHTLAEYHGQEKVKTVVEVAIKSAQKRGVPVGHILLYGNAGLGKTTLSYIIANEMQANTTVVVGSNLKTPDDLISTLIRLRPNDILFIDEIHRMSMKTEEVLYSAMEDFTLSLLDGDRPITIRLSPFTLIGATTLAGDISKPLRDRFIYNCKMELYSVETLTGVVKNNAAKNDIVITEEAARFIASLSRGVPRIANKYANAVRDFALAKDSVADIEIARGAMNMLGVKDEGLTETDIAIIETLYNSNHPLGLSTIADIVGEDDVTIAENNEPYLLTNKYIEKTRGGRIIAEEGIRYYQEYLR